MAKKGVISTLVAIAIWLTGILVALAVGFGMIDGVLSIRWIPSAVTVVAGWIVVIATILGAILAIFDK
jgi:hypothetical protein